MSFVPSNVIPLSFTAFVSLDADNTFLFISAVLSTFPSPTCAFVTPCGLSVLSACDFTTVCNSLIHFCTSDQNQLKTVAGGLYPPVNPFSFNSSVGSVPLFFHSGILLLKSNAIFAPPKLVKLVHSHHYLNNPDNLHRLHLQHYKNL